MGEDSTKKNVPEEVVPQKIIKIEYKKGEKKGFLDFLNRQNNKCDSNSTLLIYTDKGIYVDILDLIKKELDFVNFTDKRFKKIEENIPDYPLEFRKNKDGEYKLDKRGSNVKNWLTLLSANF